MSAPRPRSDARSGAPAPRRTRVPAQRTTASTGAAGTPASRTAPPRPTNCPPPAPAAPGASSAPRPLQDARSGAPAPQPCCRPARRTSSSAGPAEGRIMAGPTAPRDGRPAEECPRPPHGTEPPTAAAPFWRTRRGAVGGHRPDGGTETSRALSPPSARRVARPTAVHWSAGVSPSLSVPAEGTPECPHRHCTSPSLSPGSASTTPPSFTGSSTSWLSGTAAGGKCGRTCWPAKSRPRPPSSAS